jgi:hypothetical protein
VAADATAPRITIASKAIQNTLTPIAVAHTNQLNVPVKARIGNR